MSLIIALLPLSVMAKEIDQSDMLSKMDSTTLHMFVSHMETKTILYNGTIELHGSASYQIMVSNTHIIGGKQCKDVYIVSSRMMNSRGYICRVSNDWILLDK